MRDSEVVASIVAGDPAGLAEAYDRYAAPLYSYCRTLLREPADAADAVQDTFLIASTQLANLRNPERLRAWLYAVARNECLRMLKSRQAVSAFDEAPDVADEASDVSGDAERAELRALLRAAIHGLNSGEREIIELQAWHGLAAGDAAAVLGITRGHAHMLLSRARDQLAASVGVLLVGRSGRRDCPELARLLADWDGQLTVLLRKRVSRHIGRCEVCSDRQRRELRPAMLLSLFPGMAAAGAAAAEAVRHAGTVPAGLRDQLLAKASSQDPSAVAHRVALGQRIRSFGDNGFPKARPATKPVLSRASRGQVITAAAGTAAVAAVAIVIAIATSGGPEHVQLAGGGPHGGGSSAVTPGPGGGGSGPSEGPTARPSAGASATPPSGGLPGGQAGGRGGGGLGSSASAAASQGTASGPGSSSSAGSSSPATGTSGSSTPPPSSAPPSSTPPSSAPPPPHTTPPPPPHTTPPPAQGTLSVSPTTIVLTPLVDSTITLTANGGPVSWWISGSSSLLGQLNVSPSSGTIAAGPSHSVPVTLQTSLLSLDSQLTVVTTSGQQVTVTVLVGVGLLARVGPR
jgi:RNA polymerase sigma factor (sigma-70 family)